MTSMSAEEFYKCSSKYNTASLEGFLHLRLGWVRVFSGGLTCTDVKILDKIIYMVSSISAMPHGLFTHGKLELAVFLLTSTRNVSIASINFCELKLNESLV